MEWHFLRNTFPHTPGETGVRPAIFDEGGTFLEVCRDVEHVPVPPQEKVAPAPAVESERPGDGVLCADERDKS